MVFGYPTVWFINLQTFYLFCAFLFAHMNQSFNHVAMSTFSLKNISSVLLSVYLGMDLFSHKKLILLIFVSLVNFLRSGHDCFPICDF